MKEEAKILCAQMTVSDLDLMTIPEEELSHYIAGRMINDIAQELRNTSLVEVTSVIDPNQAVMTLTAKVAVLSVDEYNRLLKIEAAFLQE